MAERPVIPSEFRPLGNSAQGMELFEYDQATFALLPGGEAQLGFDPSWRPTAQENHSWRQSQEEFLLPGRSLTEFVAMHTRPARTTWIPPLLVEVKAQSLEWEPLSMDDRVLQNLKGRLAPGETLEYNEEWRHLKLSRSQDGHHFRGWRNRSQPTYAQVLAELEGQGFRLPSQDEWEYACAAGSRSLFHWGDHVPCDCYPDQPGGWDLHRRPNRFGLSIASNPYQLELLRESGLSAGGDGGSNICGGMGFFMGWLPLASAWFEPHTSRYDADEPLFGDIFFVRRVLEI